MKIPLAARARLCIDFISIQVNMGWTQEGFSLSTGHEGMLVQASIGLLIRCWGGPNHI